jgi:hypothetical protein
LAAFGSVLNSGALGQRAASLGYFLEEILAGTSAALTDSLRD